MFWKHQVHVVQFTIRFEWVLSLQIKRLRDVDPIVMTMLTRDAFHPIEVFFMTSGRWLEPAKGEITFDAV